MTQALNPTTTSARLALSNSNQTATSLHVNASWQSSIAANFVTDGLWYWEWAFPTLSNTSGTVGIANATAAFTDIYIGSDTHGLSCSNSNTLFYNGGSPAGSGAGFSATHRGACALDVPHGKIWWQNLTVPGGWNSDVIANQNPATNTGGIIINATITASPIAPAASVNDGTNSDAFTMFFAASSWIGTPPSGFGPFDLAVITDTTVSFDIVF